MATVEGAGGGIKSYNTGYNKKRVEDIGLAIQETYKVVTQRLRDEIQKELIIPMGKNWYAPEAIEFFSNVSDDFKEMGRSMAQAYKGFRDWVEQAGQHWAEVTAGTWTTGDIPHLINISERIIDLDLRYIHYSDDNGNIILDEIGANRIASNMSNLKKEMLNIVRIEHEKLEASTAFIGNGQGAAATKCFTNISDAIASFFSYVETLGGIIEEYANKYKAVAEDIAQNFNAAKMDIQEN